MDPHAARGAVVAGALEVGLRAWRAGENIERAIAAAGYASSLAQGVINYISQDPTTASREADSIDIPEMKRQKMSTSTVPVSNNVKKYVKGCMDRVLERKFYSQSCNAINVPAAGVLVTGGLENIVQGDSDTTREGNIIHVRDIKVNLTVFDNGIADGLIRTILVWDKQCNGAAPAITDILTSTNYYSHYNHSQVVGYGGSRFSVLYDRLFVLQVGANVAAALPIKAINEKTMGKKAQRTITYKGNAGTIADIATNSLYWLYIGSTATQDVTCQLMIEYTDN